MKLVLDKQVFVKEMSMVQLAISSQTTIPILVGMKMEAKNGKLKLTGSNSEISIERIIEEGDNLEIKEEGSVVVTAKIFAEIVKKLPVDAMSIVVGKGDVVRIQSGKSKYKLNGLPASDYPKLPDLSSDSQVKIETKDFKKLVESTMFAASKEELRPILTGVKMDLANGILSAVATNSHRLSLKKMNIEGEGAFDTVIPAKSLSVLMRSIRDEESLMMRFSDNQVLFENGNMHFYSRLLEGIYPDTTRLIPTTFATKLKVDGKILFDALERASVVSNAGMGVSMGKLSIKKDSVLLTTNSAGLGEMKEELDIELFEGDELDIAFNIRYIRDALIALGKKEVEVSLISPVRPFIIDSVDAEESCPQLVTPIRTY